MTHRGVDMVVAISLIAIGGLTMYDSYQVGIGWEGGPQSGYFPFYIGLLLSLSRTPGLGQTPTRCSWPAHRTGRQL